MKITTDIFILTGEWQDLKRDHLLRYYGLSKKHGCIEIIVDKQRPLFFIPRAANFPEVSVQATRKPVALKGMNGEDVDALYFPTQKTLRHAAAIAKASGVTTYEADIKPERRYLMERFINAQARVSGKAVKKGRLLSMRNPQIAPCEVTPSFKVVSLDIETGVESGLLYSIAVHLTGATAEEKKVFMLSDRFHADPEATLFYYPNEKELLSHFFQWLAAADPNIIIGWHVIGFDLMFLEKKCHDLNIPFNLSVNDRSPFLRKKERFGNYAADISGRIVIDGPAALRGAFYSFPDFKLETVAQQLLGKGKLIQSDEEKIAEIDRLFREDKPGLARYNLEDCILVTEIFRKTGLIDLYARRSQISGLLLNQVGMSVAAFDYFYLPALHRKGFVAPNVDDVVPQGHAAGGYVMDPVPGIYEHVAVLDFKSLYPSIIQSFKIDPLSLMQKDIDPLKTPTGHQFSSTEHILPAFIDKLMALRSEAKAAKDGPLSQAIKILMNSFYGVMGTYGCRFYHPALPSAITGTGQWLLKGCRTFLEGQGYRVLYGDTDSVFVQLKADDVEHPEAQGEALAEKLNEHWQNTLSEMGVTSFLEMEYEKYYRKFVLPLARGRNGGARKRYTGMIDNNGKIKLEFVGMEYVRSDWTLLAREFQHELYRRILTGEPIKKWMNELVKSVTGGHLDDKLIYRKHLRKAASEYTKNISPQVKAARMLKKPTRDVQYLITKQGPVPVQLNPTNIDYQHYIDKQLKPLADSILGLLGTSFDELVGPQQLNLFHDH